MQTDLRVGIPIVGRREWSGGIAYIELLIKAVNSLPIGQRPMLFLIVDNDTLSELDLHRHLFKYFDGIIMLGPNIKTAEKVIGNSVISCPSIEELIGFIDFSFPDIHNAFPYTCSAAWITDFQHRYFPELFSDEEFDSTENLFKGLANDRRLIVFSSRDAEQDFRKYFPDSKTSTKVLSFFSLPQEDWYKEDPREIITKYDLPERFLVCCNQFMVYKNHKRLFEAIAAIRKQGIDIHVVCTGLTYDYRVPEYFPELQKYIDALGIKDLIHILGLVPRTDQIQVIRYSMAVVQPTLFEGWSTVVEDSRVLGKTIILSDLPVNIEQNPAHAVYFKRTNALNLAEVILKLYPSLKPGPDFKREEEARNQAYELANGYANNFLKIAIEAKDLFRKNMIGENIENKSILVIYNSKGHYIDKSETIKSLKQQKHKNFRIIHGVAEEIELNAVNEDYVYFLEEGCVLKDYFFDVMLSNIGSEDCITCGVKIKSSHKFFNKNLFPSSNDKNELCFKELNKSCIIFKTESLKGGSLGRDWLEKVQVKNISLSPLEVSFDRYLKNRLNISEKTFIYGAGSHTELILQHVNLSSFNICGIIDKDEDLKGQVRFGYKIYNLTDIVNLDIDRIIISSATFEGSIYEELKQFISDDKLIRIHYN